MKRIASVILFAVCQLALFTSLPASAGTACSPGEWKCSDDAYTLNVCEDGGWKAVECMRDSGQLCEAAACVDPWRYGSPAWPRAGDEPLATRESLAEKARWYDEISVRLHLHPDLKFVAGVVLPCAGGPGDGCTQPAIPPDTATWRDVEKWLSNENDGLWSALYLTAEAYRYAVTRDKSALETIRLLMDGETARMSITGVPGIFTRQYIPPGIDGLSCPENPEAYVPMKEKTGNKWLRIGDEGCVWYVDRETREWTKSEHCGLGGFAGWCWLDDVSKDEYSGHMFALGAVVKLVDDPQIREAAIGLLRQVGDHLIGHRMQFTDWDGRVCTFGRINTATLGDYIGFNAAMSLDFMKIVAEATGDPRFISWYEDCLLQKNGKNNCLRKVFENPRPYTDYLDRPGLYVGPDGCGANYNNVSMHMLSLHNLIWFERDSLLREIYQRSLDIDVFRAPGQPRAVMYQNNALFDFIFAAQKRLGPGSDGPAYGAVENGIRMLRRFPARKTVPDLQCPPEKCVPYCNDRFDRPTNRTAFTVDERCVSHFLWWADPFVIRECHRNDRIIEPPSDYLLAYWMGRYYGFISEDM